MCARALIEAKADIDKVQEDGFTALMLSCRDGHDLCARALIEAKANIHAKRDDGQTALGIARSKGHTAICLLLDQNTLRNKSLPFLVWESYHALAAERCLRCLRGGG